WYLVGAGGLVLVVLFHVSPIDLAAVNSRGYIVTGAFGSAAGSKNQDPDHEQCDEIARHQAAMKNAATQESVCCQINSSAGAKGDYTLATENACLAQRSLS